MANTCSYLYNGTFIKNAMCYKDIIDKIRGGIVIIIEKEKFYKPIELITEYLNDLKEIGYNIDFTYNEPKKRFEINIDKVKGLFKRVSLVMAIRFIWEGYYRPGSYGVDEFIFVFDKYFELKKLLVNETNKLKILCLACNCFLKTGKHYNTNHFFSYEKGCKVISNLDKYENETSINNVFSIPYKISKDMSLLRREWKKSDFIKLFKEIKYEYKE